MDRDPSTPWERPGAGEKESAQEPPAQAAPAHPRTKARWAAQISLLFLVLFFASLSVSLFIGSNAFEGAAGDGSAESGAPRAAPERIGEPGADGIVGMLADPALEPHDPGAPEMLDLERAGPGDLRPSIDPAVVPKDAPILAVVIDDWGYGWQAARDFLAFDRPLTVAVLPHLPYSRAHAAEAHARGHQVILHLPMEPLGTQWDLSEWTVTTAKSSSEIASDILRALASVPHVSGINNHMGSKATADRRVMAEVLRVVKEYGLFFLDSRTTPLSVAREVGKELGALVLENDRFIDTDDEPERIKERILAGARLAKRRGYAVVIGHVRPATYRGLVASLPELEREGVRLAYLSEVLARAYPDAVRQGPAGAAVGKGQPEPAGQAGESEDASPAGALDQADEAESTSGGTPGRVGLSACCHWGTVALEY